MDKNISTDVIPRTLFEKSEDWSGIYISRSATIPLIREYNTSFSNGLISGIERIDDTTWALSLDDRALHYFDINAKTLLQAWRNIATSRFSSILRIMKKIRILNSRTLIVNTDSSVKDLRPFLSHPFLGIPLKESYQRTDDTLSISGISGNKVIFREFTDFSIALESFSRGDIDSVTGIGVPNDYWIKLNESYPSTAFNTTLHVTISIPQKYGTIVPLLAALPYKQLEQQTGNQFCAIPHPSHTVDSYLRTHIQITYPDYPPNEEICTWIALQLYQKFDIQVKCIKIPYSEYLHNKELIKENLAFQIVSRPRSDCESLPYFLSKSSSQRGNCNEADIFSTPKNQRTDDVTRNERYIFCLGTLQGMLITHLPHAIPAKTGWIGWDDDFFIDESYTK